MRASMRLSSIFSGQPANAGVAPFHSSSSTSLNSGASVRRVARFLNKSALSRFSPSTVSGKDSIGPYLLSSAAAVLAPMPRMPG